MKVDKEKFKIDGLLEIIPDIYNDNRGYFFESYNKNIYDDLIRKNIGDDFHEFIQDNESKSMKNVIRGMHLQYGKFSQAKLIRCIHGSVYDVALDLRPYSPTFGMYDSIILSADKHNMFYIPREFAHGFCALEDNTIFQYKVDNIYNKDSEVCIKYDDLDISIDWPTDNAIVSDKDLCGISFHEYILNYINLSKKYENRRIDV